MQGRLGLVAPLAAAFVLATSAYANAGFVASVSGDAAIVPAPASSVPGASLSDQYQVWDESSGALSSALHVDQAGQSGNYDGLAIFNNPALGTTLASGTSYASTMIMLDPRTTMPATAPIASITFTSKIIGLALFGASLNASDIYGKSGTIYPTGLPNLMLETRGIDIVHADKFMISTDGKTLSLQLTAGFGGFDQLRVLTGSSTGAGVPEPASLAVWCGIGAVFAGLGWFRRTRMVPSGPPAI